MPESKEMRSALSKGRIRLLDAERRLMTESPDAMQGRLHLVPGTPERGAYLVGYLAAMKDVIAMLEGGEFPYRPMSTSPSSPAAAPDPSSDDSSISPLP